MSETPSEIQSESLSGEMYAVATNNADMIAYGGASKQVWLQKITRSNPQPITLEGEPSLAMQFDSPITKVQFVGS